MCLQVPSPRRAKSSHVQRADAGDGNSGSITQYSVPCRGFRTSRSGYPSARRRRTSRGSSIDRIRRSSRAAPASSGIGLWGEGRRPEGIGGGQALREITSFSRGATGGRGSPPVSPARLEREAPDGTIPRQVPERCSGFVQREPSRTVGHGPRMRISPLRRSVALSRTARVAARVARRRNSRIRGSTGATTPPPYEGRPDRPRPPSDPRRSLPSGGALPDVSRCCRDGAAGGRGRGPHPVGGRDLPRSGEPIVRLRWRDRSPGGSSPSTSMGP